MQSLSKNHETSKASSSFTKNEIFKETKISFFCTEESSQIINNLECFERSNSSKDYGPIQDELPRVEVLSKQITAAPSQNSRENYKNNLTDDVTEKLNLSSSNITKKDTPKDSHEVGCQRTIKCTFFRPKKVGDIISTSRSGHMIERRGDNSFVVTEKVDPSEGCDSNDNIIDNQKTTVAKIHDVNDNPSDRVVFQREEETSLSENGKSGNSDSEAPCGIGLLERLIRSHPVWFLPGIQRAGAVHLLQEKEEGNFIVRQSSQPDTMAVSVRLPASKGPYIEHYLIQANDGQLSLESSENMFESIPSLIAHYCQCCDELPVQLTLPRTIREAKNRQQLSSLALLGQEFWRYPMANPRPPESNNSSPSSNKSDSLSSFDGVKKVVKLNNEIILDLVPLHRDSQPSSLSTFKSSPPEGTLPSVPEETKPKRPHTLDLICTNTEKTGLILGNKTPPQPPPRWTKPTNLNTKQFSSSFTSTATSPRGKPSQPIPIEEKANGEVNERPPFLSATYPTTHLSPPTTHYNDNVSSPQSDQTNLRSFAFERDMNSLKYFQENKKPQLISPVSDNTGFVSKTFEKVHITHSQASTPTERVEHVFKKYKKETKLKESAHYQECNILESPTLNYYKSNVADKQSDYEDIWAGDSFTTFKPHNSSLAEPETRQNEGKGETKKTPDLLEKLDNKFKPEKERGNDLIVQKDFQSHNIEADEAQNSPFYAEPADALVVRRKTRMSSNKSRHSDPFSVNNWSINTNPYFSGGNVLDRIDSQNEMNDEFSWKGKPSLSFDNIINLKKKEAEGRSKAGLKCKNFARAKPVRPPKVDNMLMEKGQIWTVDSSWEFIGNEENEKEGERRFPSIEQQMDSEETACKYTVQEIIIQRFPQFKISKGFSPTFSKRNTNKDNYFPQQLSFQKSESSKSGSRISAYDNLTNDRPSYLKIGNESDKNSESNCDNPTGPYGNYDDGKFNGNQIFSDTLRMKRRIDCGSVTEDNEDTQTIFSEPWDSSRWENLLPSSANVNEDRCFESNTPIESSLMPESAGFEPVRVPEKFFQKKIREKLDLAAMPLSAKGKEALTTGASIRSYALHLASDKSTTFAQNIDNFIECTLESKETNPQVVMRNMRQFMSGMKNYLVKHGEREFEKQVEKERMKLKSTEFLNLDAILEEVMHKLVVRPLREHLYKLFVDEYFKNGAIQLLYDNLIYARTKSLRDLGLKAKIVPPSIEALEMICHFITKLQIVDSPLEKLDHLLACVSTIIHSVKASNQEKANIALGADDILPLFVWVLVQSGFIAAEIEAEYMWGLLHSSLLSGEGCYYLTTLSSAVHVLKNLKSCDLDQSNKLAVNEWRCRDLKSVLKIIVPDELHGSILTKTLPVKPNMTTKDVCKIIAHKIRITNPQDYGLFRLVDGEETLLNDNECPQDVKSQFMESGKHCTLAYKRIDAKIGWPRTA